MKYLLFFQLMGLFGMAAKAQDAKLVTDCTITYDINVIDSKADSVIVKAMSGATRVVYIRSNKVRTDLITSGFQQVTLQDAKSDSIVVLRTFGNNKFISYLNHNKQKEQLKKFDGVKYTAATERKVILGYECVKTVASLPDGTTYNIFYAPTIKPSNASFEAQFSDVPGFILEYESQSDDGKVRVRYTASKMTMLPVPVAKFDIPTSGYRVL